MCLNEENVLPVSHTLIVFERCCLVRSCCDASLRSRNAYQHVSDFYKSRIVAYRDGVYVCDLSYLSIAARVGRDPITVSRIWKRWVQDGNTERRAGSQRLLITSSQEARHVTRMALMDRAATSRALSQELGTFARQQMSTQTVRRCMQQHGLSSETMATDTLDAASIQKRLEWRDQR
ncbi:HTH_Tnp_Tc3_2 domain-containing protein [Trichonephila clavipes]|nr:HTH_Tnp_Tc3_2 domain-containing protein [Trichonephila clavipes]